MIDINENCEVDKLEFVYYCSVVINELVRIIIENKVVEELRESIFE